MKNTGHKKATLVCSDESISKLVHMLLNSQICRNINTMEKSGNPVTIITGYCAPNYIDNIVLILTPRYLKSKFTCGKWGENMTVDQCPPCTLSEDCDTVRVPSKYGDVFLHPHQCCPLVLQPIVAWRFIISSAQKS